jgi:hypothetical protein
VRPFVRELTHTLELPPAHAEIYGGPHAEWLRDCLEYLPGLQCLLVNGLPFFDHASLLCLRHASLRRRSLQPLTFPVFGLRLLDASGCTNTTSNGLSEALPHFPNLVSLDLSRTPAAKDRVVLSKLSLFSSLRLLSLKGLGLRDVDFDIIALSIGTRVRSLDVSDNHLTDKSTQALLDHCLREETIETHVTHGPRPPVEHERLNGDLDTFQSENVAGHVRRKLTGGFVGSLAVEMARDHGITHLYLSQNAMTVDGISRLVRTQRLQVLDVGILPTSKNQYYDTAGITADDTVLTRISRLVPYISNHAANLKYLRVNYEIITEDAPIHVTVSPRAELDGDLGRYAPSDAHELEADSTHMIELDTTDTTIFEAPGDYIYPAELGSSSPRDSVQARNTSGPEIAGGSRKPAVQLPNTDTSKDYPEVKRGAAYAPEPVFVDVGSASPPQDNYYHESQYHHPHNTSGLLSPILLSGTKKAPSITNRSRHNSIHYVEDRRARLELRQSQENCLHPSMLPKVHTLVLTDVPVSTTDTRIVHRLIQYIKDAAEEASIARQRAIHSYALPPGRSRATAEKEHAQSLFALKRIVFEMAPPEVPSKKVSTSWRAYPTKSSTEDADSEAFWEAATYDFSFFGEEECGLPDTESRRTLPLAAISGLELAPARTVVPSKPADNNMVQNLRLIDVIDEVAKFRKDTKAKYDNLLHMGYSNPELEGYWPGDVTVIRQPLQHYAGEVDCYGNRYESGWFYR